MNWAGPLLASALLATSPAAYAMTQAQAAQASAHDRLFELFKQSDDANLRRNPLQALYRGDLRFADHLGDLYSDAHYQAEKAANEHDLDALHAIPRDRLSEVDRLAYDTFEFQAKDTLRKLSPDLLPIVEALPMNHFYGLHTEYPTISGGEGAAPFRNVQTMRAI